MADSTVVHRKHRKKERQVAGTGEARANVLALNVISCCIFNLGGGNNRKLVWGGDTISFAEGWKFVLRWGRW